jgi:diacylglycerol kinase family enzyme
MLVFVNPTAGGGRALRRWHEMKPALHRRYGPAEVHIGADDDATVRTVRAALAEGQRFFVAAGGDGAVQRVLQAVMEAAPAWTATPYLGAIGLGSSNDFYKPFRPEQRIGGTPCKLDAAQAARRDVGVLTLDTMSGGAVRRYWLLNSSLGVTARANAFFNAPDAALARLKRCATPLAILYAALHTLLTVRPVSVTLTYGGREETVAATNLAVVKSPFCSGSFRYDSPFEPASGAFHVHLCEAGPRRRLLYTLWQLGRGRFRGLPGTRSWTTRRIEIATADPVPVEFDGEIVWTRRAEFSIASGPRVCR